MINEQQEAVLLVIARLSSGAVVFLVVRMGWTVFLMKRHNFFWSKLGLLFSLVCCSGPQLVHAGYVDEVLADQPFMWWRLDEPAGEELAENSGEGDIDGGTYVDAELGVPGLIATEPNNTAARFDGDFAHMAAVNGAGYNTGGPWDEKSVVLWFQADEINGDFEQSIYDQGGTTRGLNVYVYEGQVHVGAWNRGGNDGGGVASPWPSDNAGMEISVVSAPIEAGEIYQVALVMDGDLEGFEGTLTGYLNGEPIGTEEGIGGLFAHSNGGAIGGQVSQGAFPDKNSVAADAADQGFAGIVDEVAMYNVALSADRIAAQYAAATGGVVGTPGDFNNDGVLDAADIDLLAAEIRGGANPASFDLNGDSQVNADDQRVWVDDIKMTYLGDSNLDGEFNSSDFVQVFTAGEYEDGVAGNSTWAEGDWNADGEFDSSDFVAAFTAGGYEIGPRVPAAVPEPSSALLIAMGLILPLLSRRRNG